MNRQIGLLLLCMGFALSAWTQTKTVRGFSDAQSGMLYYDVDKATDQKNKRFLYTICPEEASCMQLDYTLVKSALAADFIRIYLGKEVTDSPLQSLGGMPQDQLFQIAGSCITIEFMRDQTGLESTWSLLWRSEKEGDCIRSGEPVASCPEVTEVCGPVYEESFPLLGTAKKAGQAVDGSCLYKPSHSSWYKFMIQQDGQLQFSIQPQNGFDDFDWVLWKADSAWTNPCPDSLQDEHRMACNYAAGRGSIGRTGMDPLGTHFQSSSSESPFSRPVGVAKGDVFFLLVNDFSTDNQGFTLNFNEVVLACENPPRRFVPINHQPITGRPKIPSYNQFSRYTRILRLDLSEKANQALGMGMLQGVDWSVVAQPGVKALTPPVRTTGLGLAGVLVTGLKLGRFPAYAADDMASPVQYGDLVDLIQRRYGEAAWHLYPEHFAGFANHVELIVDEIFDRTSGRKRQNIRMVRLIWSDEAGETPDCNVAVFQFSDLIPYLDQVSAPSLHNDAQSLSLLDYINSQLYTSVTVHRKHKDSATRNEAAQARKEEVEFEDYNWDR